MVDFKENKIVKLDMLYGKRVSITSAQLTVPFVFNGVNCEIGEFMGEMMGSPEVWVPLKINGCWRGKGERHDSKIGKQGRGWWSLVSLIKLVVTIKSILSSFHANLTSRWQFGLKMGAAWWLSARPLPHAWLPPRSQEGPQPRETLPENCLDVELVENFGEVVWLWVWCERRASWVSKWLYTWEGLKGSTWVVIDMTTKSKLEPKLASKYVINSEGESFLPNMARVSDSNLSFW